MDIIEPNRNADFEWATRLNRIALNFLGIWPRGHKNAYDKFVANVHAIFTFIFMLFIGVIPYMHTLLKNWGDLIVMIDNLQFCLPISISVMKFVVIWWKRTDLLMVINMIADDWMETKIDKERCIMIKQAQKARILTIAGYCIMFMSAIISAILPFFGISITYRENLTNLDKILPVQTEYIYDKQSPYFEITYVAQVLMMLICSINYTGVDSLLGLLIFHLCGQLENLKEKLINMKQFESFDEGVVFIVKKHMQLIKCFYVIENTFNLLLLGLLIYFGTIFCFYGFIILSIFTEGKNMSAIRFTFLVCTIINFGGHMCLFCAVGEILITKCEAMYYAVCEYEWYELNQQKAKTLLLIMIRANKPLYITAGKMFPMTMSMFCNLIKTSAGYISVLLAMQTKKS